MASSYSLSTATSSSGSYAASGTMSVVRISCSCALRRLNGARSEEHAQHECTPSDQTVSANLLLVEHHGAAWKVGVREPCGTTRARGREETERAGTSGTSQRTSDYPSD
jgi:hypothetical protein